MYYNPFIIAVPLIAGLLPAQASPETLPLSEQQLTKLEQRLENIDNELSLLAQPSLRTGVGSIGFRSAWHTSPAHKEWVEIELEQEAPLDQIILVPALWRDAEKGFQADAFPEKFRILAGRANDNKGKVIGTYHSADALLPRIAPLVIDTKGISASWVRIEATRLASRNYDKKYVFQLSEILVFSATKNVALRRPVIVSSAHRERPDSSWNPAFLVDGQLPYLMDAATGLQSVAYLSGIDQIKPVLTLDLGIEKPISSIHLHALEQSDTVPQAFSGDMGIPPLLRIEGSKKADFSDAKILLEAPHSSNNDLGPINMWNIPVTPCRYLRLFDASSSSSFRIGFAEIEIFSEGLNVARGIQIRSDPPINPNETNRSITTLTDGQNLYGKILPIQKWLNELARRHELETERPQIAKELAERYARQKTKLQQLSWVATFLLFGTVIVVMLEKFARQRAISRTRKRIAANLHDELGANLHAIGLLGDFAKKIVDRKNAREEWSDLAEVIDEVRALTEETGQTARHCTDMLEAEEIHSNLIEEMKRTTERLLTDIEHKATFRDDNSLQHLSPRRRIDLYLFYKECLTNIIRHSTATFVSTQLTANLKNISLIIQDNGHGLAKQEVPESLHRRAILLGASVMAENLKDGGTQITLKLHPRRRWPLPRNVKA